MGGHASKQQVNELKQQHQKDVADDRRAQAEAGEQKKREIDAQLQRTLKAEREKNEQEVAEAARVQLAKVDAEIAELESLQDKHELEMIAWRNAMHNQANNERAQLEAEAMADMEKRKKEHDMEAKELEKKKNALNAARAELLKTGDEGSAHRTGMQTEHNVKTDKQKKEHNDYILAANASIAQHRLEQQQEMKRLVENGRVNQQALLDRSLNLQSGFTAGGRALMDSMDSVAANDDFRLQCNHLRMQFKTFKDAYTTQERVLASIASEMGRKKRLTKLPQTEIVNGAFGNFVRFADGFNIPPQFENEYRDPLDKISSGITSMLESVEEIQVSVDTYQDLFEVKPIDADQAAECHAIMKEHFDTVKTTVVELVKLVRKFEIPISNAMVELINKQADELQLESQIQMAAIGSAGMKSLTNK